MTQIHKVLTQKIYTFCRSCIKQKTNPTIKEREMKFNILSNDLNIKLIKGTRNSIFYMKEYINNGENLKIKPTDSNLKNKCIVYCPELPFEILYFPSYLDIKVMNIISSDVEINECKLLDVKLIKLVNVSKQLGMSHFLGFFKQLKEEGKIKSDNTDDEFSKYIELNKKQLDYMMIRKFKDSVTHLKVILEEI